MLVKFSYPYIFGILDCRPSESALSSSDVCVSRIEGIKCLFGKDVVAKHDPSTLMMHGPLYLRICGREHVCVLCRRTKWRRPYVRLLFRNWSWSPTGGGVVGRTSGYSPDTPLPAKIYKGHHYTSNDNKLHDKLFSYLCRGVSVLIAFLLSLPGLGVPCW